MTHRTTRSLTALAIGAVLALAGCTSGGGKDTPPTATQTATSGPTPTAANAADRAALDAVKVTWPEAGGEPTAAFTTPFSVSAIVMRLDQPGDGAALKQGQKITMNFIAFDGNSGETVNSTWTGNTPESLIFSDKSTIPELNDVLNGQKVGTRIVIGIPGSTDTTNTASPTSTPAQVMVGEVEAAVDIPLRAEGAAVVPPAGLPTVTLDATGKPSLSIPAGYQAPTSLVAQTLIKGTGAAVTADQSVTVQYTGWLLDGTVFDSSWENGSPLADFPLVNFIQGWQQGLVGQTVGSQVLLIIPPDLAYGATGQGAIPANATLVFVVDILDAT